MSAPSPAPLPFRVLILGLGNDLLGDDAVGLQIVRNLRADLPALRRAHPAETSSVLCEIAESSNAGLALLDEFSGFDEVVIVDAVQTGSRPAGYLHHIDASEMPSIRLTSPHFLGIPETLGLGRELGLPMPRRVTLFAIEVTDPFTLSTHLSRPVAAAFPRILESIETWLSSRISPPHDKSSPEA